jgi:hypothetical protein
VEVQEDGSARFVSTIGTGQTVLEARCTLLPQNQVQLYCSAKWEMHRRRRREERKLSSLGGGG